MKNLTLYALIAVGSASVATAQTPETTKMILDRGFAAMDTNKDGKIDRAEFDRFVTARMAREAAAADAGFAQLDTNKDGKISPAEAAASPLLAQHFDLVDANHDGSISKDELRDAMLAAQSQ